jgi:hypothetical protein
MASLLQVQQMMQNWLTLRREQNFYNEKLVKYCKTYIIKKTYLINNCFIFNTYFLYKSNVGKGRCLNFVGLISAFIT